MNRKLILLVVFSCLFLTQIQSQNKLSEEKKELLQKILNKQIDNKKVFGTTYAIKYKGEIWSGAAGNITIDQPFYIASTTKLFVTAIIMQLRASQQLTLNDPLNKYFDSTILKGLHIYKGQEYSYGITIKQLLSHTSGLPDYFEDKNKDGKSLVDDLMKGNDQYWTFEDIVNRCKQLPSLFAPGTPNKAHYSDLNFQLLGKIIEKITGMTFDENVNIRIIKRLQLNGTYMYRDSLDKRPIPFYYTNHPLLIPKAMTSVGPDGGMISTTKDLLVFIENFFKGAIFPVEYIEPMKKWNPIFFPLESGIGIHRFRLPRMMDPFNAVPELVGHSGLSGTLAYYSPKDDLFIVGTVNQVAYRSTSFQLAIKLIQVLKK